MRLGLDFNQSSNMISAYRAGEIVIAQQVFTESVLINADMIVQWAPQRFEDLSAAHFEILTEYQPELVILGTGAKQQFPKADVLRPMLGRNIGVETMDTGAACRTYNIVVAEGRRVLAALLMI